jgi:alkylation response protein AidB-like acyl-CoA dehydrogenase
MISFLPGLKSAGGTEEILRNTIGERVLGPAARAAPRQGHPVQRAAGQGEGGGGAMNLELSDEQQFLQDAAQQALSRVKTVEAAREQLDGGERPDLWPSAVEAGWPGLLVTEERGGAGLSAFDAMLVLRQAGRQLAGVELLGHLPASALLDAGGYDGIEAVATGETRACFVPAAPPGDLDQTWTVESRASMGRADVPTVSADGTVTGEVAWVVDAPGADLYVVVGVRDGEPVAVAVEAGDGVSVQEIVRYDPTRRLGHVAFSGAAGTVLEAGPDDIARAWFLVQSLIAAEAVGTVSTCLEMATQYAKERFTFGRAIGSYQAVKHGLVEILRTRDNAESLLYYAGWAFESSPDEFPIAASAARAAAGRGARLRRAREHRRARRHRRDVGARRAAVLPPRAARRGGCSAGPPGSTDRVAGELLRRSRTAAARHVGGGAADAGGGASDAAWRVRGRASGSGRAVWAHDRFTSRCPAASLPAGQVRSARARRAGPPGRRRASAPRLGWRSRTCKAVPRARAHRRARLREPRARLAVVARARRARPALVARHGLRRRATRCATAGA